MFPVRLFVTDWGGLEHKIILITTEEGTAVLPPSLPFLPPSLPFLPPFLPFLPPFLPFLLSFFLLSFFPLLLPLSPDWPQCCAAKTHSHVFCKQEAINTHTLLHTHTHTHTHTQLLHTHTHTHTHTRTHTHTHTQSIPVQPCWPWTWPRCSCFSCGVAAGATGVYLQHDLAQPGQQFRITEQQSLTEEDSDLHGIKTMKPIHEEVCKRWLSFKHCSLILCTSEISLNDMLSRVTATVIGKTAICVYNFEKIDSSDNSVGFWMVCFV